MGKYVFSFGLSIDKGLSVRASKPGFLLSFIYLVIQSTPDDGSTNSK